MPAFKLALALTIILSFQPLPGPLLCLSSIVSATYVTPRYADRALEWLSANQSSTGSYGDYDEHWTAAAAYALWLNNSQSDKAALSYTWLSMQLGSDSSWFWGQYGEADVPGVVLHSIVASQHLGMINMTDVSTKLLDLQQPNGGFKGYYDATLFMSVASSVDTSMALWGLAEAGAIDPPSRQSAADYLVSLQNTDGSFNLTEMIVADPIYSQAPEPVSLTALSLLALKAASYTATNSSVARGLAFLSSAVQRNFTDTSQKGHVYSAALTSLALDTFGRSEEAATVISFIVSQQNTDGGFADSIRSSTESNALDTGWAAITLLSVQAYRSIPPVVPWTIIVVLVVGLVALALAILVYYRRRTKSLR